MGVAADRRAIREGAFDFRQWPLTDEELRVACRHAVELLRLRLENRNLHKTTPADRRTTRHEKTERSAMERAAFARLTAYIGQVVAKASTRVLEKALGEPESGVAVTDVMTEALLADEEQGEWAAALLRGAHTQRELLKQAGGTLSASEVGTFLGISRAAVDKRRRQGALLGLRLPSGDFAYPAVQFSRNDVLPGLRDVLGAFKIHDPWMQLDILLSSDPALQGRSGFQALAEGDSEEVEARVANVGEQGL